MLLMSARSRISVGAAKAGKMEDIMRDDLAAPRLVDRITFQAELDARRGRD
jgi:hypothetical protein